MRGRAKIKGLGIIPSISTFFADVVRTGKLLKLQFSEKKPEVSVVESNGELIIGDVEFDTVIKWVLKAQKSIPPCIDLFAFDNAWPPFVSKIPQFVTSYTGDYFVTAFEDITLPFSIPMQEDPAHQIYADYNNVEIIDIDGPVGECTNYECYPYNKKALAIMPGGYIRFLPSLPLGDGFIAVIGCPGDTVTFSTDSSIVKFFSPVAWGNPLTYTLTGKWSFIIVSSQVTTGGYLEIRAGENNSYPVLVDAIKVHQVY